jgi:hypothetical protein
MIDVPDDFEKRLLTPEEILACDLPKCNAVIGKPWLDGDARDSFDRWKGKKDRAIAILDPRVSAWTARMAGAAECHVACYFGAAHGHWVTRIDTYDVLLPNGMKAEVKWSNNGWLTCSDEATCVGFAEVYIHVAGTRPDKLRITGAVLSERMLKERHSFGYRNLPYAVPVAALHRVEEFCEPALATLGL